MFSTLSFTLNHCWIWWTKPGTLFSTFVLNLDVWIISSFDARFTFLPHLTVDWFTTYCIIQTRLLFILSRYIKIRWRQLAWCTQVITHSGYQDWNQHAAARACQPTRLMWLESCGFVTDCCLGHPALLYTRSLCAGLTVWWLDCQTWLSAGKELNKLGDTVFFHINVWCMNNTSEGTITGGRLTENLRLRLPLTEEAFSANYSKLVWILLVLCGPLYGCECVYHIVPNTRACLKKRASDFWFWAAVSQELFNRS